LAENNWQPNFQALEKLDLSKVKLMWVSYPHMPTGEAGNLSLFENLVAFAKKYHILLVNDNPYSFVLNNNPMSILQVEGAMDVTLELNSLSKTYNMAGWRVGMVCGRSDLLEQILKVKSNMDSGMFYGIQKGAIAALKLDKSWFDFQNSIYEKRRKLIFELAEKLKCTFDKNSVGMFLWAKLPIDITDEKAFVNDLLYDKNLFITPGSIFGSNGNGYVRFSLCIDEGKIKEAIDRF
jgi:aspartate/methionine/tyrosine aminotransferase